MQLKSVLRRLMAANRAGLATTRSLNTNPDGVHVITNSGPVEGFKSKSTNGKEILTFYGIPYAEPPVGELRFRSPLAVKPWTNTFKATELASPCPQVVRGTPGVSRFSMVLKEPSEDCLKLNIWVPINGKSNAPVMVFIHGGGFLEGSSQNGYVNGIHLASQEDVVVVTMNYRLGPLGFLYLGNDTKTEIPGNAGLFDQQLALKWVKENIGAFGGDPANITIFGCSAGAASVGLHLLSPGSRNLFNRAIMMSGSPANPRVVRDKNVLLNAVCRLLDQLNYCGDVRDEREVLRFLRSVDFKILPVAGQLGTAGILDANNFGPTVDGSFLPQSPNRNLETRVYESNVDLMIGNVSDESMCFFKAYFPDLYKKGDNLELSYQEHLDVIAQLNNRGLTEHQIKWCSSHYLYLKKNRLSRTPSYPYILRDAALAIASDALYNVDVELFAESYSAAGNKVYRYVFDQKLPVFKFPQYAKAVHVSDQISVLGTQADILSEELVTFGQEMGKRWADFARYGYASIKPGECDWPTYESSSRKYAYLKAGDSQILSRYRNHQFYFWKCVLPHLKEPKDQTKGVKKMKV